MYRTDTDGCPTAFRRLFVGVMNGYEVGVHVASRRQDMSAKRVRVAPVTRSTTKTRSVSSSNDGAPARVAATASGSRAAGERTKGLTTSWRRLPDVLWTVAYEWMESAVTMGVLPRVSRWLYERSRRPGGVPNLTVRSGRMLRGALKSLPPPRWAELRSLAFTCDIHTSVTDKAAVALIAAWAAVGPRLHTLVLTEQMADGVLYTVPPAAWPTLKTLRLHGKCGAFDGAIAAATPMAPLLEELSFTATAGGHVDQRCASMAAAATPGRLRRLTFEVPHCVAESATAALSAHAAHLESLKLHLMPVWPNGLRRVWRDGQQRVHLPLLPNARSVVLSGGERFTMVAAPHPRLTTLRIAGAHFDLIPGGLQLPYAFTEAQLLSAFPDGVDSKAEWAAPALTALSVSSNTSDSACAAFMAAGGCGALAELRVDVLRPQRCAAMIRMAETLGRGSLQQLHARFDTPQTLAPSEKCALTRSVHAFLRRLLSWPRLLDLAFEYKQLPASDWWQCEYAHNLRSIHFPNARRRERPMALPECIEWCAPPSR